MEFDEIRFDAIQFNSMQSLNHKIKCDFEQMFFFQVVANPGQDHLALAVAQAIEEQFGGWVPPPAERST